jgi:hypothetical protein
MTERDTTPGEQPGDQTPGTASEQQQPSTIAFSERSADELLDLVTAIEEEEQRPAAAKQAPTPEAQAKAETQAGEQPTETNPAKAPGRLSVRALPPDQQVEMAKALEMVRNKEATDPLDALLKIRGINPTPVGEGTAPTSEEQTPAPPTKPQAVAEIETKIAQLREDRTQAKTVDFDLDAEEQLTSQIEDALIELQEAKHKAKADARAAEEEAARQAAHEEEYHKAVDDLERDYPDAADDDSKFSKALANAMDAAIHRKDARLSDPRFILTLAKEVDDMLPKPPSGKRPSPPPANPKPNGQGLAPPHSSINRPTIDEAKATIKSASADELLEAIGDF